MKRTAKIFVALALLFAGSAFAQSSEEINPIASKCALKSGALRCSIAQYDTQEELVAAGYDDTDVKRDWIDVVTALKGQMSLYPDESTPLYLTFETDVDLVGYVKAKKNVMDMVPVLSRLIFIQITRMLLLMVAVIPSRIIAIYRSMSTLLSLER